ncbi:MAG: type II toxin-antitoxin system VapC family toxin [Acidimicrobiia bacterium]
MLAIDTSALLKRYVDETGREAVVATMESEAAWCASLVAVAEARIALCRLFEPYELKQATEYLENDVARMALVPADDVCLGRAAEIGCELGLRTLDSIHLAAAERLPRPVRFLTFDLRQRQAALTLGFETIEV